MKILCFGDLHLRTGKSRYRKDDYENVIFNKLSYGLNIGKENSCEVCIFPGDIFHSHRASNEVKSRLIKLLLKYDMLFYVIKGQHDIASHRITDKNSPINVLESAKTIKVLNENPELFHGVNIYGASYGEQIPWIKHKDAFNILVIHKMIIDKDKLWEAQEDYTTARTMLSKYDFDLIVAGDNHSCFINEYNNKTLINLGSLTRMTIVQTDHKPKIAIYDTEKRKTTLFDIPIKPAEDVFDIKIATEEKEKQKENEILKDYIKSLTEDDEEIVLSFSENIENIISKKLTKKKVVKIISEVLYEDE